MPSIITREEINSVLPQIPVISAMKEAFIQYSNGNAVVPPVGELIFENPPGDVHIKYGYIKNQDYYVIKIASGFYENTKLGIPSGQGLMLLFKQKTGELEAILLDDGHLTNIRTVSAGTLAIKYFAYENVKRIGIMGTGTIAKLQIQQLQENNLGSTFWLWGRNKAKAHQLKSALGAAYDIRIAESCQEVAQNTHVMVTTTPADSPLLHAEDIRKGSLIVAIGSDTEHKQELDAGILQMANLVVADSMPQSKSRGEIYQAVKTGAITLENVIEFGKALQDSKWQHSTDNHNIIVVDLTGVAVQDIMIASSVFTAFQKMEK